MEKKYECECGRTISESDWLFLNKNYGEMPVCGCIKCHACDVMVNPNNDPNNELKNVLCEEAGWITLCKDCPVYVQCYKCGEYVHPDKAMVVGECAGYYDHVCINDEGETYNCDE